MKDIILLHYNNYFNRQVKKAGDLETDYTGLDTYYTAIRTVNFNPSDGVDTSIILGKGEQPTPSKDYDTYDYLIVTDPNDNNHPVLSRWFIIDRNRTRDGQFDYTLKRDVIADNYNETLSATTFIEKGMVNNTYDPLLYNSENMTYNQIKVSEIPLKDKSNVGWIVGYIPQDAFTDSAHIISKDVILQQGADEEVNDITTWEYFDLTNLTGSSNEIWAASNINKRILLRTKLHYPHESRFGTDYPEHKVKGTLYVPQGGTITNTLDSSTASYDTWSGVTVNHNHGVPSVTTLNQANYVANNMPGDTTLWSYASDVLEEIGDYGSLVIKQQSVIDDVIALDNKLILDTSTNLMYRINVINVGATTGKGLSPTYASVPTFMSRLNNDIVTGQSTSSGTDTTVGTYNVGDVTLGYDGDGYKLELSQVFVQASITIDGDRNHLIDAPYDMFCIPYTDEYVIRYGDDAGDLITSSKAIAIGIAQEIAKDAGSGSIYDTQLLPYCPCEEFFVKNTWNMETLKFFDFSGLSTDLIRDTTQSYVQVSVSAVTWNERVAQYGQLYDENFRPINYYAASNNTYYYLDRGQGEVIGAIIWCSSNTRTFDIDTEIYTSYNVLERKVESECDFYRLCSGNYQGIFEFNAAKSYGVSGFRVDCTFKPYNPYIHIVPKLGGIYGSGFADFKDARGLICGGDFSLAQLSNAWANYELQNKNYQNIFDRQIQNLDVMSEIAQQEAAVSLFTGGVSGGVSGAISGSMMTPGSPVGGIIGGIAGATAGIVGGVADYNNLLKKQDEVKSFTTDMYGYQLGNIKAIPTSLSKNSALTANTKIFPFVEKYTCTDVEKQALRDKITYNGMTIMKIGTMTPYVGTGFFKGQIIRFNGLNDDTHMANAIYSEINKGVYI